MSTRKGSKGSESSGYGGSSGISSARPSDATPENPDPSSLAPINEISDNVFNQTGEVGTVETGPVAGTAMETGTFYRWKPRVCFSGSSFTTWLLPGKPRICISGSVFLKDWLGFSLGSWSRKPNLYREFLGFPLVDLDNMPDIDEDDDDWETIDAFDTVHDASAVEKCVINPECE